MQEDDDYADETKAVPSTEGDLRQTAIGKTATWLEGKLTHDNVADLVIMNMVSLLGFETMI